MLGTVHTAWLFTRGLESVRIIRAASRAGINLIVHGPGELSDVREFSDVMACMNYQADLERRLVAEGFALERFTSDRRVGSPRTHSGGPERRRMPQFFL